MWGSETAETNLRTMLFPCYLQLLGVDVGERDCGDESAEDAVCMIPTPLMGGDLPYMYGTFSGVLSLKKCTVHFLFLSSLNVLYIFSGIKKNGTRTFFSQASKCTMHIFRSNVGGDPPKKCKLHFSRWVSLFQG